MGLFRAYGLGFGIGLRRSHSDNPGWARGSRPADSETNESSTTPCGSGFSGLQGSLDFVTRGMFK